MDGVEVVHRTDYNYADVVAGVEDTVARYASLPASAVRSCRTRAHRLAKQALWSRFIAYYREAYDIALRRAEARCDQ